MASDFGSVDPAVSPTITATRPDVILGTAAYMSPEQARGKAVDKRADVWAFGRDGKGLYFLAPDDYLMAVPITAGKTDRDLKIGNAVRLVRTNMVSATAPGVLTIAAGAKQQYDVSPDGCFLLNIPVAEISALQSPSSSTGQRRSSGEWSAFFSLFS